MARQVYYDPFGMRTAGYQQGIKDEVTLQDQTRRARAADWDHTNVAPLRLNALRRADDLGAFGQQYEKNKYGINERQALSNLASTELPHLQTYGQITGDQSPYMARLGMYGAGQYLDPQNTYPGVQRYLSDTYAGMMNNGTAGANDIGEIARGVGVPEQALGQMLERMPAPAQVHGVSAGQYHSYDRDRQTATDDYSRRTGMFDREMQVANLERQLQSLGLTQMAQQIRMMQQPQYAGPYTGAVDFPGAAPQAQPNADYGLPQGVPQGYTQIPGTNTWQGPQMVLDPNTGQYVDPQQQQQQEQEVLPLYPDYAQDF